MLGEGSTIGSLHEAKAISKRMASSSPRKPSPGPKGTGASPDHHTPPAKSSSVRSDCDDNLAFYDTAPWCRGSRQVRTEMDAGVEIQRAPCAIDLDEVLLAWPTRQLTEICYSARLLPLVRIAEHRTRSQSFLWPSVQHRKRRNQRHECRYCSSPNMALSPPGAARITAWERRVCIHFPGKEKYRIWYQGRRYPQVFCHVRALRSNVSD
jgi:hypothetical protein